MLAGVRHLQAGRLQEAEISFNLALTLNPQDPLALNCLGIVARTSGDQAGAHTFFSRAIAVHPHFAEAHSNLGNVFRQQGKWSDAERSYEEAIRLKPTLVDAHNGLAATWMASGDLEKAEAKLHTTLQLHPQSVEALNNLGNLFREQGKPDAARNLLEQAHSLAPQSVEVMHNLALVLIDLGLLGDARHLLEKCVQQSPQFAEAWSTLGICFIPLGEWAHAAECTKRAAELRPQATSQWINLHNIMRSQDRTDEASFACERLIQLQPDEPLHTLRRSTLWPAVFQSKEAMRLHSEQSLQTWNAWRMASFNLDPVRLSDFACEPPFNLQFIADDVRLLKQAYAGIFSAAMDRVSSRLNLGSRLNRSASATQQPIPGRSSRFGFVVTRGHEGVFLKSMGGLIRRLNPDAIEASVVVFCPQANCIRVQAELASEEVTIIPLPSRFDQAAETIRNVCCDVLLYWEIGTDAMNYFLPFLRLAPVQCTSWGVQVTSGIPNVDFYLSCRLAESPQAATHYSEKLLLADTLLTYQSAVTLTTTPRSRQSFGFSNDQNLYVCAQQLGKFHPDFDHILAEILRTDSSGVVVVTEDRGGFSGHLLRQRWSQTIADVAQRIVFVPRLNSHDYLSLLLAADVLLDPLHFGGVNSTYDGLALGKPIITLPSAYHRGRYTLACYQRMQVLDCVAESPVDYITRAVQVATNIDFRKQIESKIVAASPLLFNDDAAVREHERLIRHLIHVARNNNGGNLSDSKLS